MDNQTEQIKEAFNEVYAKMARSMKLQMIRSLIVMNERNCYSNPSVTDLFDEFIEENREAIMQLSIEEVLQLSSTLSETPE